ncbi:DUF5955 family protein [Spirillospora sp. CA-294931]|uniref:DUF5955 family protein n=1 Tax=Spirillospora sp. CA-294931 TaxID=3240042 RepID=UPI003D8EAB42
MDTSGDRGVNIGGSASVSGQISTGDDSVQIQGRAEAPSARPTEVEQALARVAALLDEHAADLTEPERARRDLADVQEEAAQDDPDPERMEGALGRLARRVAPVVVLTEAVQQLTGLLGLGA